MDVLNEQQQQEASLNVNDNTLQLHGWLSVAWQVEAMGKRCKSGVLKLFTHLAKCDEVERGTPSGHLLPESWCVRDCPTNVAETVESGSTQVLIMSPGALRFAILFAFIHFIHRHFASSLLQCFSNLCGGSTWQTWTARPRYTCMKTLARFRRFTKIQVLEMAGTLAEKAKQHKLADAIAALPRPEQRGSWTACYRVHLGAPQFQSKDREKSSGSASALQAWRVRRPRRVQKGS